MDFQKSNIIFHENYPEGDGLCHAGRWTNMTKLMHTFHNTAIMTKKAVCWLAQHRKGRNV